jgi:crossover junction endodeoxyribonuclease RuvC
MDTQIPTAVGIDLSLTDTGVAIAYDDGSITTARVRSKGTATDTLAQRAKRLDRLVSDVIAVAGSRGCSIVIEQPAYSQTGGAHHDRSGLWWMLVDFLTHAGDTVIEVAPTTLKKYATGKGNASKDEVLAAVIRRYPAADVSNNNVADAVVLAALGARHAGFPLERDDLSIQRRDALSKVRWSR